MALGLDEILIRMRLMGARQVAAEAQAASGSLSSMGSRMESAGRRMSTVGRGMTTAFTVPLALIGGAAIKMGLDFDHAMEQIHTQAGASSAEVHTLSKQVLDFAASGESTHGPKDLADALFHIESSGYRGARAMEILRASEALATTGAADMESTTNALVGAMNSGIKGAQNMHQTIGTLNATVGAGNMRMEDLTSAMGTGLLTNARQMGVSLPQVGAALATLTRQGQPAEASATRLAMAFRMMMSPTDKAKDALGSIGLSAEKLGTMMQAGKFPEAVGLLSERLHGLGDTPAGLQQQASVIRDIFGARSSAGINAIIQGLDTYGSALDQIGQKGGDFDKLHGDAMENSANRMKVAWAQVQSAMVELGHTLIPIVAPAIAIIVQGIVALLHGFNQLPGPIRTGVVIFMLLLAVAGPILIFFGGMVTAIGVMLPILAALFGLVEGFLLTLSIWVVLIAAVAIGFYLLYTRVTVFRNAVNAVISFLVSHWRLVLVAMGPIGIGIMLLISHFRQVVAVVTWVFHAVVNVLGFAFRFISFQSRLVFGILTLPFRLAINFIAAHFGRIRSVVAAVFGWIGGAAQTVANAVKGPFGSIAGFVANVFNGAVSVATSVINSLISAFNSVFDRTIDSGIPGVPVFHGMHIDPIGGAVATAVMPTHQAVLAHQRALGGPVIAGMPYTVGESGRELFVPNQAGSIIPHGRVPSPSPIPMENWHKRLPTIISKVYLKNRQIAEAVAEETAAHRARR